jgi:hypothetical protein
MPESIGKFVFEAPILRQEGGMRFHYIPVPVEIADTLLASGSKRVLVSLSGKSYRRAIQSSKTAPCVVVGMNILREVGYRFGDIARIEIEGDRNSDKVDLGEEFEEVLNQDEDARKRFNSMTTGQQRSLAYYVTSAKRVETRIKRSFEIARKLRTYTLYSDLHDGD